MLLINNFGRLESPKDGRDNLFRMMTAAPQMTKPQPRKRPYNDGPLLNQGNTPQCVGYSSRGFLDGAPLMLKSNQGPTATALYREAQEHDEWPGTSYDGSSIRGGVKAMEKLGLIKSYAWGQRLEEAIAWMNGGYGTIIAGTNWYAEMSNVDERTGFMLEPPPALTTPIGGHAYRWIWYDVKRNGILIRNSWGTNFGYTKNGIGTGYAFMSLKLAQRLINEWGEITAPTQVKIAPMQL